MSSPSAPPTSAEASVGRRTLWFTLFSTIGLVAASTSSWVHVRILNDPTYASFCDVNESFSCTVAYTSRFGSVAGVPVALLGVLFFTFVLLVIALCARSSAADNLPGYLFAASTIGLSVVLYLGYASFFILKTLCVLCLATYVAVAGLFVTSGTATRNPMTNLASRAMRDLQLLFRTPSALGAMVLFMVAAVTSVLLLREPVTSAAELTPGDTAPQAVPTATAAQLTQLEQYLVAQPRKTVIAPSDGAVVVILKFNDYQCPGCGQTYRDYKAVLAKWAKQAPGKIKFIMKDYPLERECNQFVGQDLHLGACEAAVAVRLAREKGKGEAMEEWLYSNQPAMNPDTVKKAASSVGGVPVADFEKRYAGTIELVKADISQGAQLKIGGTPTFFMNGMQLPGLRAEFFDAAIAWELKRVSGGK